MMLAECSGVGLEIDLAAVPRPDGVALDLWLRTFPSFGYVLSVPPENVAAVAGRFAARDIAAARVGTVTAERTVLVSLAQDSETIRDLSAAPLIGCGNA